MRHSESHKGDFGHGLAIGGALGMSGAAIIAGSACLRCGAGLVTVAAPENSHAIAAMGNPCYMTISMPLLSTGDLDLDKTLPVLRRLEAKGAVAAIGPGLGRSPNADRLAIELFRTWKAPTILDADALNALSESDYWKSSLQSASSRIEHHRVLTPHPGEWQRLSGVSASNRMEQIQAAQRIAQSMNCIIVLKGHRTWITDGIQSHENETGNPSLAVGGSGDCLTGMILAFLCQGLAAFDAAVLAVHLHGLAADICHEQLGTPSSLATDLIGSIPAAWKTIRSANTKSPT